MKKSRLLLLLFFAIITYAKAQPQTMWQLLADGSIVRWTYSGGDEFNDTLLDTSKWDDCFEWGCDCNLNCYYIRGDSHRILENGILKLVTKYEPGYYEKWHWDENGKFSTTKEFRKYTSGMIVSKQKFKYGFFEIRFKLPAGKGLWPAFWLFGGNPNEEFDIFEYKGETPNKMHIDMHCPERKCRKFGSWWTANGDFSDGFNTMAGEWNPEYSFWYLNNRKFATWLGSLNNTSYLIANAAVAEEYSSNFGLSPDSTTPLPANFEIDYIRVYTQVNNDTIGIISNHIPINTDMAAVSQSKSLDFIETNEQRADNRNRAIRRKFGKSAASKITNSPIFFIKIYFSPIQGEIRIEFEGTTDRKISIELQNSLKQVVVSKNNIIENTIHLNTSHLPKGVYFLKGTFGDKTTEDRIILD